MTNSAKRPGPCAGLKIIEFATMISGPLAGQILGDLGADVIKIEPAAGDPMRHLHPMQDGMSAFFVQVNRNKRSIALDLKDPEAIETARALCADADVVIENFRPGVMKRLGLGPDDLSRDNPGLIYASITGFGADGPYANRPAYDHVIQGMTGMMRYYEELDGRPDAFRNVVVDKIAAQTIANGVLAALLERSMNGGNGQTVSTTLLDAYAAFILPDIMLNHTFQNDDAEQIPHINTYYPIKTSDGYVIGYVLHDVQFEGLCKVVEREDLIGDDRFKDTWSRITHFPEMWREIESASQHFTTQHIVDGAAEHSVPIGSVNTVADFFNDPQVQHNKTIYDREDARMGTVRQIGFPVRFSNGDLNLDTCAPGLSEQADEILAESKSGQ